MRIIIPGFLNEELQEYLFLLEDKGVITTKAKAVVDLAAWGVHRVLIEMRNESGHGEG
jgi:hypothetical protein